MNDYEKIAELLYPEIDKTPEFYFNKYPKRNLNDNQVVSRYAPSPTGFMHIGNFFQMFIAYNLTRVTNGVMFLRVEDTDSKREKKGALEVIYEIINRFGIKFNEYQTLSGEDIGEYGPYVQSQRTEIYKTFAKYLVSIGRAFPCFCKKTEGKEDVLKLRETKWAEVDDKEYDPCRDLSYDEVKKHIDDGEKFAIRLKTLNNGTERIKFNDLIKGEIDAKANAKDFVIVKNDGIPPYAFAHAIDDTLMGTTIVVRGEEYISSTPAHIELFDALGFKPITYCHNPLICKIDEETGNRRKISKRLDPEADMRYYFKEGYPINSVLEYLLNIINSNFEDWRKNNLTAPWQEFTFGVNDISATRPIFDLVKLNDVSKKVISRMSAEEVYDNVLAWAKEYDLEFYDILSRDKEYAIKVFDIDRGGEKPRKDIAKWSEVREYFDYMFLNFDDLKINLDKYNKISNDKICTIINKYAQDFDVNLDKNEWFMSVKGLASASDFCTDNKLYKQNPEAYLGNTADFCGIIRLCITGKENTPDLFTICKVLGREELIRRAEQLSKKLK